MPDTLRFGRERVSSEGEQTDTGLVSSIGGLDAVVGNPPYIRQRNIENRAQVRDHLSRVGGEHLSKMSDIYSYFLTHSTEFLANGGQLGFITSNR